MSKLGERLNALRTSRGLSLEDVAKSIKTTKQQIFRIEHGQVPSADTLSRLAVFFSVSADYLLGHVDEPNRYLEPADLSADELRFVHALRGKSFQQVVELLAALMAESGVNGGAA